MLRSIREGDEHQLEWPDGFNVGEATVHLTKIAKIGRKWSGLAIVFNARVHLTKDWNGFNGELYSS